MAASPLFTDREAAREILSAKITSARQGIQNDDFCSHDLEALAVDAEFRLRWIDCAPDGANHLVAPLQGKDGTPLGNQNENVGPGVNLRIARSARGLCPLSGRRLPAVEATATAQTESALRAGRLWIAELRSAS